MQVKFYYMDDVTQPEPGHSTPVKPIERATTGSAGYDLKSNGHHSIGPGEWKLIPTGVRMKMEGGYLIDGHAVMIPEAQVRTRSGMALKRGLVVLNSPGTIDADYNGEIGVILHNVGKEAQMVSHGERIAQLVFAHVEVNPECVVYNDEEEFEEATRSIRGSGGFGSTGK
jgi:dUTP pyrophosphatase